MNSIRGAINIDPADTPANKVRVGGDWSKAIQRVFECETGGMWEMFYVNCFLYAKIKSTTLWVRVMVQIVSDEYWALELQDDGGEDLMT